MSDPKLPRLPHLLDDDAEPGDAGSSLVRAALRGARADVPDAARMDAISAAITGAIGGGDPGGGDGGGGNTGGGAGAGGAAVGNGASAGAGAGGGTIGTTALILGGVVVIAAIGFGVLATRSSSPVAASATASASASATSSAAPAPTIAASPTATPSAAGAGTAEAAMPPVLDVHTLPAAPSAPSSVAPGTATTRPSLSPDAEMALLQRAQDSLRSAPSEALARCEEHERTYRTGALAEEREVIAVDALLRLGRRSEAEARAKRFRLAHPGSGYVRRLDTLLGSSEGAADGDR